LSGSGAEPLGYIGTTGKILVLNLSGIWGADRRDAGLSLSDVQNRFGRGGEGELGEERLGVTLKSNNSTLKVEESVRSASGCLLPRVVAHSADTTQHTPKQQSQIKKLVLRWWMFN